MKIVPEKCLVLILYAALSRGSYAEEPAVPLDQPTQGIKAPGVTVIESPVQTSSNGAEQGISKRTEVQRASKPDPEADKVERFITPFTNWIEEKVQDSSITNPAPQKIQRSLDTGNSFNLRDAIKQARQHHPGTVLSADRIETQGGLSYRVKILSQDGVVRMVEVAGPTNASTGQEQP